MGGEGEVAEQATLYLRIAALGAPFFMLADRRARATCAGSATCARRW